MEEEQKNHSAMASEVQHQQSANTEFQVSHSQMILTAPWPSTACKTAKQWIYCMGMSCNM